MVASAIEHESVPTTGTLHGVVVGDSRKETLKIVAGMEVEAQTETLCVDTTLGSRETEKITRQVTWSPPVMEGSVLYALHNRFHGDREVHELVYHFDTSLAVEQLPQQQAVFVAEAVMADCVAMPSTMATVVPVGWHSFVTFASIEIFSN